MNRSQTITSTSPYKKLVVLLIVPFALLVTGAKWAEKPVENLDAIAGEWRGKGKTDQGLEFYVAYRFRRDGSYGSSVIVPNGRGWSFQSDMPPGTLQIKEGKLEYRNDKGLVRTGVLYQDKKGRRVLKFHLENGAYWKVRAKKE